MNCYISSGAFLSGNLEEILPLCADLGFNLELGPAINRADDLEDLLRRTKHPGRYLIHNYFPPPQHSFVLNLASLDQELHQRSVELCRRAIDFCVVLGAPFYSVHAGFAMHLTPGDLGNPVAQKRLVARQQVPRKKAYELFARTVIDLANYAQRRGVGLLVENNVMAAENLDATGQSPLLLAHCDEIAGFFREVGDSGVRLLLDVAHAKVTARTLGERPEAYFEQLGPWIEALHLSENDGIRDTNQRFDQSAWFSPFLDDFRAKPLIIEVYRLTTGQIQEQHQLLKEMVN